MGPYAVTLPSFEALAIPSLSTGNMQVLDLVLYSYVLSVLGKLRAINEFPVGALPLHFGPFPVRSISSSEMASEQNSPS